MNFPVTGGAGFIGSQVCERLLRPDHHVGMLDGPNSFYEPVLKQENLAALAKAGDDRFHFIHGNITERPGLNAVFGAAPFDQVLHLPMSSKGGNGGHARGCALS